MLVSLVCITMRAMSKRKLPPKRVLFTLSPSPMNKIKQLFKDKPEHVGLKVGVRTRGCKVLSYSLEYTMTKGDSDEVIHDTETDYMEDKLSGEFVFNNPTIKGTCGCGESFNV